MLAYIVHCVECHSTSNGDISAAVVPLFISPMENCLDLAIRTEGAAGSVAPTIDRDAGL